jgi:tRNA(fMet)-specific endonuclease VapC
MKLLLDTNICIYVIKKKPATVLDQFRNFTPADVGVSSITVLELMYGVYKSQRPIKNLEALNLFLTPLNIVDFDKNDATMCGKVRADLEAKGQIIGPFDLQIAAQALGRKLTLVSNNLREFNRVPHLKTVNWQ